MISLRPFVGIVEFINVKTLFSSILDKKNLGIALY